MPLCVKVIPPGGLIGTTGPSNAVTAYESVLVVDSTCATGFNVYTQAEIEALQPSGGGGASAPDPERMADMQSLFYAFLLVLVLAWGAKQLLNLFSGDTSRD